MLIVGEAAGAEEASKGEPFVGEAGFLLDRVLRRAGEARDAFRVHNVLSCRPPNNYLSGAPWEFASISHCAPNLDDTIRRAAPRVIIALGNTALRRLTGHSGISRLRGWPLEGLGAAKGVWVVPTFHPSFLLPRPGQKDTSRLMGAMILDIKKARKIADQGFKRETPTYLLDPSPERAAAFALEYERALEADPTTMLSWDIETPGKLAVPDEEELDENDGPLSTQILRVSFCFRPGYALSVPWEAPWKPVIERLLRSKGDHVVWNGYAFDLPVVAANGLRPGGRVLDGMWAWHVLQSDLPRGLEAVGSFYAPELGPWKHKAGSDPAWYNACDADVALRNVLGIKGDLLRTGQWGLFEQHVVQLWPILWEAGRRGVMVDGGAQAKLRDALEAVEKAGLAAVQGLVPKQVKPWKRRKKLPKTPEAAMHILAGTRYNPVDVPAAVKTCSKCGAQGITKTKHMKGECRTANVIMTQGLVREWNEVFDFNPLSTKQLIAYARYFGHPLGSNHKNKRAESIDKRHLEKLEKQFGKKHPIYAHTLELREVQKTLGTYVNGFKPDAAGRIHTTYTFAPSTGRLSSRAVNLQNVSHRSEAKWADDVRRTIVPAPGHVFVEADSAAIEAVMAGFFMEDPTYIRLARSGVHAWLACQELGWDFTPENKKRVKQEQLPLYDRKKRTVHGVSYGMTSRLMVQIWPKDFPDAKTAQREIDILYAALPKLGEWHHAVRVKAHDEGYLQNPWGYRHYFYDIFKRDRQGKLSLGSQGKAAIAFLPQSSAAAFMRDSLLQLGASKWRSFLPANLTIHDSICLEVPEEMQAEAVDFLGTLLTRSIPCMNGLQIGCEIKTSAVSWADMHSVREVTIA